MGLEEPGPGSATFHFTFCESLQVVAGGRHRAAMPEPFGPRNCGQSEVLAMLVVIASRIASAGVELARLRPFSRTISFFMVAVYAKEP